MAERARVAIIEMTIIKHTQRTSRTMAIHKVEGIYIPQKNGRNSYFSYASRPRIVFTDLQLAAVVDIINNIPNIAGTYIRRDGGWRWQHAQGSLARPVAMYMARDTNGGIKNTGLYLPPSTSFYFIIDGQGGNIEYTLKEYLGRRALRKGGTA